MRLMGAVKETAVAQVAMEKVMIVIFVIMMILMIAAMMTTPCEMKKIPICIRTIYRMMWTLRIMRKHLQMVTVNRQDRLVRPQVVRMRLRKQRVKQKDLMK